MPKITAENLKKRYLGCLLGHAVGNALGLPVEGWSTEAIKQKYGILKDIQIDNFGVDGNTDDDSEMTLAIAESYIEQGLCNIDDISSRFLKWFKEDARGIGIQTSNVMSLIKSGVAPFDASYQVWMNSGKQAAGNGSLMRCVPTALARVYEPDKSDFESREISKITHYDPRSTEACVLFNRFVISSIIGGFRELETFFTNLQDDRIEKHISHICNLPKSNLRSGGYVLDTLAVAIWFYYNFSNFESSLIEIVNMGGDTDTNAAVAGALLGAKFGVDAIPLRWLEHLGNRERIIKAALGLFNLALNESPFSQQS